jgi:hypothetical protein
MALIELYNLTNLTNAKTLPDLVVIANNATNQIFMGGYLVAFFIIMLMGLLVKFKFEESLLASSFACFILSLFLRQAQLINFTFVIGFLIITAMMGLYMFMKKR